MILVITADQYQLWLRVQLVMLLNDWLAGEYTIEQETGNGD